MSFMDCPNQSPAGYEDSGTGVGRSLLPAAFVIGGGSLLLWTLIVAAVWKLL